MELKDRNVFEVKNQEKMEKTKLASGNVASSWSDVDQPTVNCSSHLNDRRARAFHGPTCQLVGD
jgi:hypothetical protein